MMEDECVRQSVEGRTKEFVTVSEGKKRKIGLEEKDSRLRKEELYPQLIAMHEWMQVTRTEVLGIRKRALQKLKKIESEEQSIRSAREALAERETKIEVVIGSLDARINAVEERENQFNLYLDRKTREILLKEEKLNMKWEEFAMKEKMAKEKCTEQEKCSHDCIERLELAENRLEGLRAMINKRFREIDRENVAPKSVEGVIKEADFIRESVEKQINEFENTRKEFNAFQENKMRELVSKEEQLDAKLRNEQLVQKEKFDHHLLERLELAQKNVEELKYSVDGRFKEVWLKEFQLNSLSDWIERKIDEPDDFKAKELEEQENMVMIMEDDVISRENDLQMKKSELYLKEASLAEKDRKVDVAIGTLNEMINAVSKRERQFNIFLEGNMRKLMLKEEKLSMKREELVMEMKLADDKCREQEKLRHGCIERLESAEIRLEGVRAMMDERFKEIEHLGYVAREGAVKEAGLIRKSMEKQLDELNKMSREFISFQEHKLQELVSKEEQINSMRKQLRDSAKFSNKILMQKEKNVHELLDRLEVARQKVEELKVSVDQRFNEIGLKEQQANSLTDWVEEKVNELDSKAKGLEEVEKRVKIMEDNMISKENDLNKKMIKLDLKERNFHNWEKELEVKEKEVVLGKESNENRAEELDWKERNLNSVRDFTRNCFKEHRAIKKQLKLGSDALETQDRELKNKEYKLEKFVRDLKFKEKQLQDRMEELELKHQQLTDLLNVYEEVDSDESADIKFLVRMDGKNLQIYLNDREKDLESMGDEIFKVLHLSLDPPKLVLDAMVGFYPPHLRKDDVECKVRKICILLLEQLRKMSPIIQSHVRKEAVELAHEWKLKMRATAEYPLEVLGFLQLLAAYGMVPYFEKDEISRFVMIVGRQAPELCRVLGYSEKYGRSNFSRLAT